MNYSSDYEKNYAIETGRIVRHLIREGITISAMESCTGGLFSSCLTDTEGASAVFFGSFVTYSNEAKIRCGVPEETIVRHGVYSLQTAEAMAQACRAAYGTDIGVGITGSTGNPDPENADSVPGEVFFSIRWGGRTVSRRLELETTGLSRRALKERIVLEAAQSLAGLLGVPKNFSSKCISADTN